MSSRHEHDACDGLSSAVYRTLIYADIFGYPLSVEETHRYLIGEAATVQQVRQVIAQDRWLRERVARRGDVLTLAGRETNFGLRRQRRDISAKLLAKARRYGLLMALLPFVRGVILTGSLVMENSRTDGDDIDFFVVTKPGRLWLTRLGTIAVVRLARRFGVRLCPNYLVSSRRLALSDRSLHTAHELAQMIPLYGARAHEDLIGANSWARCFLPNAFTADGYVASDLPLLLRAGKTIAEWALSSSWLDTVERRELRIKGEKLRTKARLKGAQEACFDAACKGHFLDYGVRTAEAFQRRLAELGVADSPATK